MQNQDAKNENVKSIEVSGKTIEEAIAEGLTHLKTSRDQVTNEIIKEGKRGVFGLGAEDAQVRLTLKLPEKAPESPPNTGVEVSPAAEISSSDPTESDQLGEKTPSIDQKEDETKKVAEVATTFLEGLLERMGIKAEVVSRVDDDLVEPGEEPPLVLDITGPDLGILIGRRSETLRALQYMVRLMVSKEMSRWQPVVIDVESYLIRRRRSLHQLAEKMVERAVATQRKVVMEAMPAHERRIIHIALRNHPTVFTKSVGSDDNRKVTIIPK
jgi:spoIIIJ-associated protein